MPKTVRTKQKNQKRNLFKGNKYIVGYFWLVAFLVMLLLPFLKQMTLNGYALLMSLLVVVLGFSLFVYKRRNK